MEKEKNLKDLNVVFFESRHSKTLGELIRLQQGNPIAAPALKEIPLENNGEVYAFAEQWFAGQFDVLILLTGVGTRALMTVLETKYTQDAILDRLKKTVIVPRGPKPIRVLKEWGVPYALTVPEPNTWKELLSTLDENQGQVPLKGKRVAVQEYGVVNPELLEGLKARGAQVSRVPVYRWTLPDDLNPLIEAVLKIVSGQIQIAIFTTAVQIEHVFQVAQTLKLEQTLKDSFQKIMVASIGPDCSDALRLRGLKVDLEAEHSKMASLVLETAQKADGILKSKAASNTCSVELCSSVPDLAQQDELQNSVFLKACRCEETTYTPVWLMRQAGRYMKDYRDIRDKVSFLDLCKNPDLATEVTVTAQEKLKADAAIIFSDILLILEPMGMTVNYLKNGGPSIVPAITNGLSVDELKETDAKDALAFVYRAIRQTRRSLKPNIPLIGFAGAPFTLASYMIEGGSSKTFNATKKFMTSDLSRWNVLMGKIVRSTQHYLNHQIEAGAQVVQIFDSWAGLLSAEEYETYVLGHSRELIQGIQKGVPVIHFSTKTGAYLEKIAQLGSGVIGIDHRISLTDAWKKLGPGKALQGNMDPVILCSDLEQIKNHTQRILKESAGHVGYIFNLGHGVLPETPVENAIALIDIVHEFSQK